MAVKYLNISEAEFLASKSVHKFLSLERALQLLESKKLWFSNPVIWKDPYEQRFILGTYDGGKKFTWLGRVYCMCRQDALSRLPATIPNGQDLIVPTQQR